MDFHSLTRRELQALCKKNKIPANITNVAMADALKALEIVEGIEEFLEPCQSETADSSIESPTKSEVTSPYVPPSGGRTTRRRNVTKEEPVTMNPMTRSRRTTQKALAKHADESQAEAIETPALALQTNKKKVQIASACRKMDSQLKECVEDEKDSSETPALQGVMSRRRVLREESVVIRGYSTRRSVRLAGKNMEVMIDEEDVESEIFKKESLTKDGGENEETNFNEALDDVAEASEITDADVITTTEESSENKDKSEVVSAQDQGISSKEIKSESTADEAACIDFEMAAKLDEEKCDKAEDPYDENIVVPLNLSNEVEQTNGPYDICTSEIEITNDNTEQMNTEPGSEDKAADCLENVVENIYTSEIEIPTENSEKMNTKKDAGSEDKAADCLENVVEIKDNELSRATGFPDEIEKESSKDKDIDFENIPDFTVTMEKFTELQLQQATEQVSEADSDSIDHLAIPLHLNKDEPDKNEIIQLEEHKKAADPLPSEAASYAVEVAEADPNAFGSIKDSPIKQQGGVEGADGISLLSASKTSSTMKRTIVFSDNKENITMKKGKNTAENVENLNELSVRKLTKMLKEKLEITKKSSKNDHDREVLSRPVLQPLPENRLVDEPKS
ncbi:hypothetical protein CDL12_24709 [Handroanthus impetiginosus]|uniref:Uncharacterized protein n=1 Tax=Handroanthus impetiginosus TaxID=429701 RepID=A0A2G9GBW8_9LAMI|nr:hypothetical protein CDL12_24709 [Handroanthus impetiginosus]